MEKIIYIADDDENIKNLIKTFLEREGFNCFPFSDGESLLNKFITEPCDLVILDVMMPGRDGFTILQEIRNISNIPIIMLTARDSDNDYIEGLNCGSDDYFTKPFSPVKLVARVKSLLKRQEEIINGTSETSTDNNVNSNIIVFGNIEMNKTTKETLVNGKIISLTPTEFSFLAYLIANQGRAISREELQERIWGFEENVETRVADDAVKRLRKKISISNVKISTVWGFGFKLENKNKGKNK